MIGNTLPPFSRNPKLSFVLGTSTLEVLTCIETSFLVGVGFLVGVLVGVGVGTTFFLPFTSEASIFGVSLEIVPVRFREDLISHPSTVSSVIVYFVI